jgi:hypothetical protein
MAMAANMSASGPKLMQQRVRESRLQLRAALRDRGQLAFWKGRTTQ